MRLDRDAGGIFLVVLALSGRPSTCRLTQGLEKADMYGKDKDVVIGRITWNRWYSILGSMIDVVMASCECSTVEQIQNTTVK